MHAITQSCVLFLWIHTLTFVRSQECTTEEFVKSRLYDSNFDISNLDASYAAGKQVRVNCNVGYSGFFKLTCVNGEWQSRGSPCQPRSCGHPGDAQFADFHLERGDDFVFGSQVVYTCHKGHQMVSRTNYRRCMAEGWDGVVPVCEAQQCPVIHVDNNVQVNGDPEEATYGNVVRFSCKSNTEILYGSSEIYCDENGEWSGPAPKCKAIKCTVPIIENGRVTGGDREYNEHEILHFDCNYKYTRTEERPSKCTKVGLRAEWSPTPVCEPTKCKVKLPPLQGTSYEPAYRNVFSPGETLTVTCGQKYWIRTNSETSVVTTCNDEGEWSVRPICQEVICSNQRDRYVDYWGAYWQQRMTLGDTSTYRCRSGYKSTDGSNLARCTRDGWRPNPLCQEIRCDRMEIDNAAIVNPKQRYRNNERASYVCRDGYYGNPTRVCGKNGWSGNSQCTEITCTPRYVEHASIDGNIQSLYKNNEQAHYTCNEGYKGRFTLTCGNRGWSGQPNCEIIQCERPDIDNAYITYNDRQSYNPNDQVHYVCRYERGNPVVITCENGVWTGVKNCSVIQCERPDIDNAYITYNDRQSYNPNDQVHYACRYERGNPVVITCENGVWTGVKNCSVCQKAEIPHGFIAGPYDDKLYYSCNKGFKLFTKGWWGEATCKDHAWSGLKECIEENKCGKIPAIPNGNVASQNRAYEENESVQINCDSRFRAQVDRLTCRDGEWSSDGTPLKNLCTPIAHKCSPPPKVENAVVDTPYAKEYFSGSEVKYECRNKYKMEGGSIFQCTDGEWEKRSIKCLAYCDKLKDETVYFTEEKETFMSGDEIYYECITSGGATGTATCVDGKWNKTVECQAPAQEQ